MFDKEREPIPPGLDRMEPGPVLGALLSAIDVTTLSGYDRVVVLRAHQRMASHHTACVYEDMAAVTDSLTELEDGNRMRAAESAAAEIRAALVLTRRAADSELGFALDLQERLPQIREALAAGKIDLRRARTIAYATTHLSIAAAREVTDQIIDQAPRLTTGQLSARIRHLCIETNPDDAQQRYEQATEQRRVVAQPTEDGTSHLYCLDLPPHRTAAAMNRINRLARDLRTNGETRTMDQLRADVLLDVLEGTVPATGTSRGTVDIRVDLATLTELNASPGELGGYGPVIADIARQVTQRQRSSQWRYTVSNPDTGDLIHTGVTNRRPDAAQRREIEAAYPTCVFPGCRMPAVGCDIDHRIPWSEGGPTATSHLAPCCRHDHVTVRHRCGWTYERLPNGDHEWTSRLGHTYSAAREPP
jgi:hypothetical protein